MTIVMQITLWIAGVALLPVAIKIHRSAWQEFAEGRYWARNMRPWLVPIMAVIAGAFLAVYFTAVSGWLLGPSAGLLVVSIMLILMSVGYASSRQWFDALIDQNLQETLQSRQDRRRGGRSKRHRKH